MTREGSSRGTISPREPPMFSLSTIPPWLAETERTLAAAPEMLFTVRASIALRIMCSDCAASTAGSTAPSRCAHPWRRRWRTGRSEATSREAPPLWAGAPAAASLPLLEVPPLQAATRTAHAAAAANAPVTLAVR